MEGKLRTSVEVERDHDVMKGGRTRSGGVLHGIGLESFLFGLARISL